MVAGLPPDGALARAVSGTPWTTTQYQLAEALDRLGRMETDFRNVHRPEDSEPAEYPEPVWRPGDPSPEKKAKAAAKARAAEIRDARAGYHRIVAQVLPQPTEKG